MRHWKRGLVSGILFLAVALVLVMWVSGPYEDGQDAYVSGDYAMALRLLLPLAEQGHVDAQNLLGIMYREGHGVLQDHVEAAKWFRLAAEQGFAGAQASLGVTYLEGLGLPQDDVQALMWFNLAASRFPPGEDHDRAVQDRDTVAKRMTPAQITEAQKLAREWRPRGEQPE